MDPNNQRILELVEDNNKMLHKIRNAQKMATFWHILKFILIIAIAVASVYYLEPYLTKIMDLYNTASKIIPK
jgi:hypothetical protein